MLLPLLCTPQDHGRHRRDGNVHQAVLLPDVHELPNQSAVCKPNFSGGVANRDGDRFTGRLRKRQLERVWQWQLADSFSTTERRRIGINYGFLGSKYVDFVAIGPCDDRRPYVLRDAGRCFLPNMHELRNQSIVYTCGCNSGVAKRDSDRVTERLPGWQLECLWQRQLAVRFSNERKRIGINHGFLGSEHLDFVAIGSRDDRWHCVFRDTDRCFGHR